MTEPGPEGVHTIMPTPFDADGALDLASLEELTEQLVAAGVDGLVVLGVMGEAPRLSQAEQDEVLRTVVATAGRVPVLAGTAAPGTRLAVAKARRALELGASGLLVAPPPIQEDAAILEHYRRVAAASDRPVVLHDYPAATGIRLAPELVARLAELPAVTTIKLEDPPTGRKITRLRALAPALGILGGLGGLYLLEELGRGALGVMTGFSYPEILVAVVRAWRGGAREEASRLFFSACPLLRFEFQPVVGLAIRKEIYRRRGAIASAHVRHPGAALDDELVRELDAVLAFVRPQEVVA